MIKLEKLHAAIFRLSFSTFQNVLSQYWADFKRPLLQTAPTVHEALAFFEHWPMSPLGTAAYSEGCKSLEMKAILHIVKGFTSLAISCRPDGTKKVSLHVQ